MAIGTSAEPFDCIKNGMKSKEQKGEKTPTKAVRNEKITYASINVYSSCSPLLSEQSIMTGPTYLKR
jgi:predicted transcriptional regulator